MLAQLLRQIVHSGKLVLIDGHGRRHVMGDGGPLQATIRLARPALAWWILLNPTLRIGEAYMRGDLTIEEGSLVDFLTLLASNFASARSHPLYRALTWLEKLVRPLNSPKTSRRNVAHHYDLSDRLYELFLDRDRQYSCAYFQTGLETLEQAQEDKKAHIAKKLYLDRDGLKVLDIGCGWGGLALHLVRANAEVLGITLSEEQFSRASERAEREGLSALARFELRDYREVKGRFDRIVSVGMFEHVGKANYAKYFSTINKLLEDDGVALVHTVGWLDDPAPINPFIRKYIFPGAEVPSLSEIMAVVERSGLVLCDVEVLRQHYAHTLRHWRERLAENRDEICRLYDDQFYRMWEFYLAACEVFFRSRTMVVFQVQLAKRLDRLPLTRDYMYRETPGSEHASLEIADAAPERESFTRALDGA